jgi:PLD-like domain
MRAYRRWIRAGSGGQPTLSSPGEINAKYSSKVKNAGESANHVYSCPMATISFLNPLDQPTGRRRLLAELKEGLADPRYDSLRIIVAFAKSGPLLRLQTLITAQRARGLRIEAVFGIDQLGTSAQALKFALLHFDRVYVTSEAGLTFHSKVYAFEGVSDARIFVGSNNLTVGGTETNFEAAIRIDLGLPVESGNQKLFRDAWDELMPPTCLATKVLDETLLNDLIKNGFVPDESKMRNTVGGLPVGSGPPRAPKSGLPTKPPSPLPARKAAQPAKSTPSATPATSSVIPSTLGSIDVNTAHGLAIQIKPHHNGEIFLSVTAALQNPSFFKWPFNGLTVPKKGSNAGYPQLTPDPIVNVTVYGGSASPILCLNAYPLNTVFYETKSEIRITASPLVSVVPDYSIMIMELSERYGIDYEVIIHKPDSPDYASWLAMCNQQMPSGGSVARKFGWF